MAKPIDLWELKKQIRDGEFRAFVNNGRVYLEDVESEEAIMICELRGGEE